MLKRTVWIAVAIAECGTALVAQGGGKLSSDDMVEVQQPYAKANWALDSGDSQGYAGTFTPDGVFNNNVGHDAIVKFADGFHAGMGAHLKHWNTNLMITPSPTGATGQVYLVLVDYSTKPPSIFTSASCSDELVKTPQAWRLKKRATKGDTAPPAPPKPQG